MSTLKTVAECLRKADDWPVDHVRAPEREKLLRQALDLAKTFGQYLDIARTAVPGSENGWEALKGALRQAKTLKDYLAVTEQAHLLEEEEEIIGDATKKALEKAKSPIECIVIRELMTEDDILGRDNALEKAVRLLSSTK